MLPGQRATDVQDGSAREGQDVADKDEAEPTQPSSDAEPVDATDDSGAPEFLDAEAADDETADDEAAPDAEAADDEAAPDAEAEDGAAGAPVRGGTGTAEPGGDDEFDAIVRHSGVDNSDPDGDREDSPVLQPAGVSAASARAGKTAQPSRAARTPKGTPTGKRDQVAKPERTTPPKFVRQSVGELRKVVYPTGQQLLNYFVVVLVFVLFIISIVSLLDLGLGWAIFKIFS